MSAVEFDHIERFHLLWVVLAIVAIGVYGIWRRRRAMRAFADARLLGAIAPSVSWTRGLLRVGLIGLSLTALVVALMGPRWGQRTEKVVKRGIDIMVLLDVSRSMLARDIAPNRLERAKISLSDDLLPALGGDRVGLIAFAGAASLKCPLTSDYGFFRLTLDEISTRSAPRGGTLIGGAIRKAGEAFSDDLGNYKIILLITDGEDQESFPVEAARAVWADRQIPIVAVALGDPREGARIPVETGSGEGYLEHRGEVVWSKADFTQLRQVAEVSDLKAFIPVGTRNFDLGEIYRERIVPAIDFQRREETEQIARPSQYHPFAAAALALLLIESFLRDGRRRPARSAATGAILASDERTDKRTDKGTDRRTYKRTERTERTDKGADERSAAA